VGLVKLDDNHHDWLQVVGWTEKGLRADWCLRCGILREYVHKDRAYLIPGDMSRETVPPCRRPPPLD